MFGSKDYWGRWQGRRRPDRRGTPLPSRHVLYKRIENAENKFKRFKRWLRAQLKRLREENERRRPKEFDFDDQSQGFEAALDAVEDVLKKRRAR